ncbi:MAG: acyl-CoA dehydrogenase family protein [Candidatus Firestonebacteria bacterium]
MEYFLTEEQKMIVQICKEIAEKKVKPIREKYDEEGVFPWDIVKALGEADICGVYIPQEYGGFGAGCFELCLAVEELSKVCGGISLAFAATALGTFPILLFGSEEQKKKYLPKISKGEIIAAFGLTEANAGSDAGAMETTAKADGDYYILNGTKQWITNAGEAQVYAVIAITDKARGARGATAFLVEKDTPGFTFGKKENKMGIRASATRELVFQDCKIPKENILGGVGKGFIVAVNTLFNSRPGVAAQALGIAAGAFEEALMYSRTRKQFGQPISSFQAVQHMLADMATEIEAARALLYATCKMVDGKVKSFAKESAMCKLFCSDVAMKVTVNAVQIFGGYGYMKEYPVEKMMRDAKITQIYEGTNQIQRNEIALQLIKESATKK